MKVLLLFPPTIHHNSSPPLSLLYLGAVLSGTWHKVTLIDAAACYKPRSIPELLANIEKSKPHIIGITTNVIFIRAIYEFIAELRKSYKGKIILGGPHASLFPEEALNSGADFVVVGEGEKTFKDVVEGLDSFGDLTKIPGIVLKDDRGEVIKTAPRDLLEQLDELPFPSFDLADASGYPSWQSWGGFVSLLTSRGCPYSCTYCSRLIFGRKFRARSPENVLAEIEQRKQKWGVENIDFVDDAFSINKDRINILCDEIINRKIKFSFKCATRADFLTKEMVEKMKEAGCIAVSMGVESGNEATLKRIKKSISLDTISTALSWLNKSGIKATLNFMLGFPWEKAEDIYKTRDFMISVSKMVDHFQDFGLLVPIPGTEIYDEFKSEYGFENWWLRDDYAKIYRSNEYFPFFRRRGYNDFGLLENGFFKYSDDVKSAIRGTINFIIWHKLSNIKNIPLRAFMRLGIDFSKFLYETNPNYERLFFKILNFVIRTIKKSNQ
jgi:anaerobic magnesium-protoporphyrin IX monomethyl ester cyclase